MESQASLSYACGASLGAFKALKKGPAPTAFNDEDNLQIDYIQMKLAPKLGALTRLATQRRASYPLTLPPADACADDP